MRRAEPIFPADLQSNRCDSELRTSRATAAVAVCCVCALVIDSDEVSDAHARELLNNIAIHPGSLK